MPPKTQHRGYRDPPCPPHSSGLQAKTIYLRIVVHGVHPPITHRHPTAVCNLALGYREHWEVLRKRAPRGGIDPSLAVVVPPRRETAPYPLALVASPVVGQSRGV